MLEDKWHRTRHIDTNKGSSEGNIPWAPAKVIHEIFIDREI
jgi:hypothetical protein